MFLSNAILIRNEYFNSVSDINLIRAYDWDQSSTTIGWHSHSVQYRVHLCFSKYLSKLELVQLQRCKCYYFCYLFILFGIHLLPCRVL